MTRMLGRGTALAIDDPARIREIRSRIRGKRALERWYRECYRKYSDCIGRCPDRGKIVEIGSGGGFAKEIVPEIVTSDLLPYEGIDGVSDATCFPYPDASLRTILMLNVFHHIRDVAAFLAEAQRCLVPGGRVFMVDQQPGWISTPILKLGHHEGFDAAAPDWRFPSRGALSSANGALAWIVFQRDRALFEERFPMLRLALYRPHTPLRYFLSGGLKRWSLLPGWAFPLATAVDRGLTRVSPRLASFVDIELVRA